MAIRTILFGYKVENCKYIIDEKEKNIVLRIFNDYISGKTLKHIAESLTAENIVYYNGSSLWNKNMVNRIIENKKYTGEDGYPQIVEPFVFKKANALKSSGKKAKLSDENELIKSILFCKECSSRFRRINKWKTREKWLCMGGCKCEKYFDDKTLISDILSVINSAIADPELLNNKKKNVITQTPEMIKFSNQLNWLMDQPEIDYKSTMKSVIETATLKYSQIDFGKSGIITDELKNQLSKLEYVEELTTNTIKKYIHKIWISTSGVLSAEFINGIEIEKGIDENGSNTEQSNYEDRSQPIAS